MSKDNGSLDLREEIRLIIRQESIKALALYISHTTYIYLESAIPIATEWYNKNYPT